MTQTREKLIRKCEPPIGWGQAEEMGATACTADILETIAGATATLTKTRREFFTVLHLAPDPNTEWVHLIG